MILPRLLESTDIHLVDCSSAIQEEEEEAVSGDEASTERNGSIYLDAHEDGPSVAEILKELRQLPEPHVEQTSTPGPCEPILLHPTASRPLPPAITPPPIHREKSTSSHPHKSRRQSGVRHSFSSAIRVSARTCGVPGGADPRTDAVVELHEESAAAFQDFLFWCYPQ